MTPFVLKDSGATQLEIDTVEAEAQKELGQLEMAPLRAPFCVPSGTGPSTFQKIVTDTFSETRPDASSGIDVQTLARKKARVEFPGLQVFQELIRANVFSEFIEPVS